MKKIYKKIKKLKIKKIEKTKKKNKLKHVCLFVCPRAGI